ncbi:MAG TPA: hypothetical protein VGH42_08420 [Verrucomicrobiae bacterium]|jgi:hypothetical protein
MNITRKTEHQSDGVMVVALTPEEQAKWDDLIARFEQADIALAEARRIARRARSEVEFYLKYRQSIVALMRPLHQIQFPEYHLK